MTPESHLVLACFGCYFVWNLFRLHLGMFYLTPIASFAFILTFVDLFLNCLGLRLPRVFENKSHEGPIVASLRILGRYDDYQTKVFRRFLTSPLPFPNILHWTG